MTENGDTGERRNISPAFIIVGERSAITLNAGFRIGVEQGHQPVWLGKRQRTQKDGINHREDGQIGAETEPEREHGHGGEAGVLQELAKGEFDFVHRGVSRSQFRSGVRFAGWESVEDRSDFIG